jgi:EAL domain-containing protein (putative c-di-GMP-specific phosphodiesterase class I)
MLSDNEVFLDGNLILHFLPAVDLISGCLLGFEALVRWQHPEEGVIPPSVLLPWAEKTGYIADLNAWVLSEACSQAAGWPSAIQVAVNCSTSQVRDRQTSAAAANALEQSGLNPDRLTIEVTETTVADELAGDDLHELSRLGVHLAIDNVGTNWSTLGNLRRFAIETAKIDREFISGLEMEDGVNRAIVEAIIRVSHSLAMSTVAEGVELAQQVEILRDFGAEVAEGYFFTRPLPADQAYEMANSEPRTVFSLTEATENSPSNNTGPRNAAVPQSSMNDELDLTKAHVL